MDPDAQVDREYWAIKNPNFCWRALRLLGKTHLNYFGDHTARSKVSPGPRLASLGQPTADVGLAIALRRWASIWRLPFASW
jgi:hypothetical protein